MSGKNRQWGVIAAGLALWPVLGLALGLAPIGCKSSPPSEETRPSKPPSPEPTDTMARARRELVEELRSKGIKSERVLAALGRVERHRLVPEAQRPRAYLDRPLPIGLSQTISQPYVVALMTQLAGLSPGERVLEVGTGSGYQAAVLAELGAEVYTIEILAELGKRAHRDLEAMGYGDRIHFRIGDGYAGWKEAAPFDAIVVTAAPPSVPEPLKKQLKIGGRLVIPVGEDYQELRVLTRTSSGLQERAVIPVRFVPMTGEAQRKPQ